jgi:cold shock CspA family protein
MKKFGGVVALIATVVFIASVVIAADSKVGTVKSFDAKAGIIVFSPDGGADTTLKVDKQADVSNLKVGDKIEVSIEKDTLTQVKPAAAKRKAPVGC